MQHALHMSLGIQRELPGNMVLGAELVRRRFDDTLLGSLDYEPLQPVRQRRAEPR